MVQVDQPVEDVAAAFPELSSISRVGAGGQKVVYRAVRPDGSVVALKLVPRPPTGHDPRTVREVQAAASLAGPTFAAVHQVDERTVGGRPFVYLLEEFISGESLRVRLRGQPVQPVAFVRRLGDCLFAALEVVESARLVHRDVKPDNVMLAASDRVVLIDFGIARHLDSASLTNSHAMFGPMTLGYCAPEQVTNQKRAITIRTDLFAVGVVLYECLTGANPFTVGCARQSEVLDRCLRLPVPPLPGSDLPTGLDGFIRGCLEKAPHRRPASAAQARTLFAAVAWR